MKGTQTAWISLIHKTAIILSRTSLSERPSPSDTTADFVRRIWICTVRYCSMSWYYPTSSLSIAPRLTKRHETAWSWSCGHWQAKRRDRATKRQKPNGMGAADERLQGTGRGSCESGIDLWLSEKVRAENCSDFSHIVQSCGRIVHKFYGIIYANKENGKLESNKRMWLYEKIQDRKSVV